MKKKMISILLCAALGITTLAGCGGASGGTTVQVNRSSRCGGEQGERRRLNPRRRRRARRVLWQRKRRLTEAGKP